MSGVIGLSVLVMALVGVLFVLTRSRDEVVSAADELGAWDQDIQSARELRKLASRLKAARGVRKNG